MDKARTIQNGYSFRITSGYSFIELILSLAVSAFLLTLILPVLSTLNNLIEQENYNYQDEIGIYQLQVQLARYTIMSIEGEELYYQTDRNECVISVVNGNLISQPGYLCYLRDIDDAYFYESLDIIYLDYERDGKVYTYPVGYSY